MNVKKIAREQQIRLVNETAQHLKTLKLPPKGWLATVRNALGMSQAQLSKRRNIKRNQVSKLELTEMNGSVTLGTMKKMSEAMGCRFVYAVIPDRNIQELIWDQAVLKASKIANRASAHMDLENQSLTKNQLTDDIRQQAKKLVENQPRDLWDD